jgi:hypothetical protein
VAGRDANVAGRDQLIVNVSAGMALVPLAAAVKDPRPVFRAVGVDAFTGREWLTSEVDRFIAGNPCGYIFIEADAGLGKTAFAAWLVKTRGYLSHFSRYSGGESVSVALANLSAQLITKFGLDDQAPGGMLPDWAQAPGGFEWLLAKAAGRALDERRCSVVLVVDGLDEADASGESLPWGLPSMLPDGAYVIGTYRTGRSPRRPDAPAATRRIAKEDRRNQSDIRAYLAKALDEHVLAALPAKAGMNAVEFTELLAERCGGVWVYLRYVLDELRLEMRQPNEISDLPSELRDYYAGQIRRWKQEPTWHSGLLPLLATLGAAEEPLPAAALARLAGNADPGSVRRWCDWTIRPLLTTSAGTPLRYEIYHSSFRELLNPRDDYPDARAGDQYSYELLALADEFRQAAASAHSRICDTYLAAFGGLEAGLPELGNDPGAADVDGGYPLRQLARHLCQAGRAADLQALLAVEYPPGAGHAVNIWFAAHDHADTVVSYLDDLARARAVSTAATDQDLSRHRPAATLGMEIRYALMTASIASLTAKLSPDLLKQLIRTGVWSSQRGLDHARRIADPRGRLDALLAVRSQVNGEEQAVILAQALDAATAIAEEDARAQALGGLAPHLPAADQPAVLARALDAAAAIIDDFRRGWRLAALAPHLPAADQLAVLAQALTAALASDSLEAALNTDSILEALAALAPRLSPDLLAQALDTVTAITDELYRARALTALAPHLPPDLLARALDTATAITDERHRAEVLTGLAPHLPAVEQPAVLAQALDAATAITDDFRRGWRLAALASHLPPDPPPDLLAQLRDAATAITGNDSRAGALAALVPRLPAAERPAVLAQALDAATAIIGDGSRADALAALAPHLPAAEQRAVLAQAVAAVHPGSDIAREVAALARHLPPDLLAQLLSAATAVTTITGGISSISDARGEIAVSATFSSGRDSDRAQALAELAPHLPPDLLAQALETATAITDDDARAQALTGLAPHLPPDLLARALDAATAITDERHRAQALTRLAPHLPAADQPAVLARALAAATAIADDSSCADALAAVAPHLPTAEQPAVLAQAVAVATAIADISSRTDELIKLAPSLSHDLLAQVLASTITGDSYRPWALAKLAPHLPPDLLAEALGAAAVSVDMIRARALAGLAPHLPPDLLARALDTATAITDERHRAEALAGLAPHLPPDLLSRALDTAATITNDADCAQALTALAPRLPAADQPAVLARALAAATAITDERHRAEALAGLAPHLPPDLLPRALDTAATITNDADRAQALAGLAPYLPSAQQPAVVTRALGAATATTNDYRRVEALTALALHLPPDMLSRALAATPRSSLQTITAILEKGRSVLPRGRSTAYMDLLRDSFTGAERRVCFEVITAVVPFVAETGGTRALEECVKSVVDVHRWWP